jgi:hypothetical protein
MLFRSLRAGSAGGASCARGFSLVEALVATALLAAALTVIASLFAMSVRANVEARRVTMASVLARDKLEQLRAPGVPMAPSPPDSLGRNREGYCDFLDPQGRTIGAGSQMPDDAMFVRRWVVRPLGGTAGEPVALEVLVAERAAIGEDAPDPGRRAGAVRLATVVRRGG